VSTNSGLQFGTFNLPGSVNKTPRLNATKARPVYPQNLCDTIVNCTSQRSQRPTMSSQLKYLFGLLWSVLSAVGIWLTRLPMVRCMLKQVFSQRHSSQPTTPRMSCSHYVQTHLPFNSSEPIICMFPSESPLMQDSASISIGFRSRHQILSRLLATSSSHERKKQSISTNASEEVSPRGIFGREANPTEITKAFSNSRP